MLTTTSSTRELAAADLGPNLVDITAQLVQPDGGSLNASKQAANK